MPWASASYEATGRLRYEAVAAYCHVCFLWFATILLTELASLTATFHDRVRASRDMSEGLYGPRVAFVAAAAVEVGNACVLFYPASLAFALASGLSAPLAFARVMATTAAFVKLGFLSACCVAARVDLAANAVTVLTVLSAACSNAVDLPAFIVE